MTTCPHCGASTNSYTHAITPGLVKILLKVYKHVVESGCNSLGMNELPLTHSEYGNFQKLRFHALIAKDDNEDKKWLVTTRGADFLKGKIQIPRTVETYRNRVTGHSEDHVTITQVMRSDPVFQTVFETHTQPLIRPVDFTIEGQALMFNL